MFLLWVLRFICHAIINLTYMQTTVFIYLSFRLGERYLPTQKC